MVIYSHSRLSCFEQCPQKFKLQYIDKVETEVEESIEAFLGSRVHETLEKLYRDLQHQKLNSLDDLFGFLHDEWEKNWNASIVIVKKDYTQEHYRKMAEKFITDYYKRYDPFNQDKTIALEERILIIGQSTNNNIISDCAIYNNGYSGVFIVPDRDLGGTSYSYNNQILNCTIHNNGLNNIPSPHADGIAITPEGIVSNTTITGCTFYGNQGYGVFIDKRESGVANNNYIFHNNFLNETYNAFDEFSNTWDDGYPSGGNYWDDYTGIDSDNDGIGDTPYDIPGGSNQDRYPLGYFREPPVANFTYTPAEPKIGDLIDFTDTSTDPDGTIISWWWDFGDHYYSDLQNPIHIYYTVGTYDVTLTVTDDKGLTDSITVSLIVTSPSEEVESLIDDIEAMDLHQGLENSLTQKLMNVLQSIGYGWINDAINQLNAFINQVEAQRGKKLTEEQADYLVGGAQSIIDSL